METADREGWLRRLLVSHESRLLRYARRLGARDESAREITQECFLRLWNEDPSALAGRESEWLFCVARNLTSDVKKKEGRTTQPESEDEVIDEKPNAEETLSQHQEESSAVKRLESLTSAQQEVLRLKFQEGFSYKEISAITGHSVSYVGVLIHEAMKAMRGAK